MFKDHEELQLGVCWQQPQKEPEKPLGVIRQFSRDK